MEEEEKKQEEEEKKVVDVEMKEKVGTEEVMRDVLKEAVNEIKKQNTMA